MPLPRRLPAARRLVPRVELCPAGICRALREHYRDDPRHALDARRRRAEAEGGAPPPPPCGGPRATPSRDRQKNGPP